MSKKKDAGQNGLDLPEFDGQKAKTAKTKINGAGSVLRLSEHKGDEVFWVTRGKIKKVSFEDLDAGLEYQTTVRVVDEIKLDAGAGLALISKTRTEASAAKGEPPLPEFGEVGYTDSSGVVLTDAEVAERRGSSAAEDRAAAAWFGQSAMDDLPTAGELEMLQGSTIKAAVELILAIDHVDALRRLRVAEVQTHNAIGRKSILKAIDDRLEMLQASES